VNEFNRDLYLLLGRLTGGTPRPLRDLVEEHGRPLVSRVLADGFLVIFPVPDDDPQEAYFNCHFLAPNDALVVVEKPVIPDEYWCHEAPGALDPQVDHKLLRPYASDDPEAVNEVRRRHAEEREPAERRIREWAKTARRPA
jgi:hypothetical protein